MLILLNEKSYSLINETNEKYGEMLMDLRMQGRMHG